MGRTRTVLSRYTPSTGLRDRIRTSVLDELLLASSTAAAEQELAWSSVAFRLRLLEACGFGPSSALALAIRPEIGLEEPLLLVRKGCSPDLAVEILV